MVTPPSNPMTHPEMSLPDGMASRMVLTRLCLVIFPVGELLTQSAKEFLKGRSYLLVLLSPGLGTWAQCSLQVEEDMKSDWAIFSSYFTPLCSLSAPSSQPCLHTPRDRGLIPSLLGSSSLVVIKSVLDSCAGPDYTRLPILPCDLFPFSVTVLPAEQVQTRP